MPIRTAKRLFATATPRTYSSTVHKAAEDRGVEVVGMDNAALFGEVLYALPFGKAIERKLLTDYRVVIRVPGQKFFGTDMQNTMQWISDEHRPGGTMRTNFASGNMPANKRKIKLDERNLRSAFTT